MALIVMLLAMAVCLGLTAAVNFMLIEEDPSCAGRTFIDGKPHLCQYTERDTLYCYPKECE
jgi:hypothetical protein